MTLALVFQIAVLVMSVVAHEAAHGYAASALGDDTAKMQGRLTLNPLRHIDPFGSVILPILLAVTNAGIIFGWAKPVVYNPNNLRNKKWGDALVAAAGPATNVLIAVCFALFIRAGASAGFLSVDMLEALAVVVFINILLAIFNMMPIPPLDGSKIFFSFLPYRYREVGYAIEQYGFILLLLFILFLWHYFSFVLVWIFQLLTGLSF